MLIGVGCAYEYVRDWSRVTGPGLRVESVFCNDIPFIYKVFTGFASKQERVEGETSFRTDNSGEVGNSAPIRIT